MLTKRKNHIVITEKTSTKTIEEDYKQVKSGMKLLIYLALIEITVGAADLKLRGRELKKSHKICMYLGKEFGFQTFEVPFDKYRFFTSSGRNFPAQPGECDPEDVKTLSWEDRKTKKFCRLYKHASDEYLTTEIMSAAADWMLANEYEERACTNKNTQGTLHMDHVKEVNVNVDDWDILYDDLVDLMLNFTYGELLDAQDAIYDIWDGDYDYTSNRDIDYDINEMRTCRDGAWCYTDEDCNHTGGSCQNRNDRRK